MFFNKPLSLKTTADVISSFSAMIDELEMVERRHAEEAERQTRAQIEAEALARAATAEVIEARSMRERLLALVRGHASGQPEVVGDEVMA